MKKLLSVALLVSLISIAGCQKETGKVEKTTEVSSTSQESRGTRAYDFKFTDVNGKTHRLSDFRGKVVIVQFFGTYCPPCRAEMPVLDRIYKKYGGKVVVIGLSVDYSGRAPQELKPFVERMGVSYTVAPAPERAWDEFAGKITGLDSIPQTYIIDKRGFIRYYEVGFSPSYEELFVKAVDQLLKEG
jgi:thiol-disulfide isomerase/thioredoxin